MDRAAVDLDPSGQPRAAVPLRISAARPHRDGRERHAGARRKDQAFASSAKLDLTTGVPVVMQQPNRTLDAATFPAVLRSHGGWLVLHDHARSFCPGPAAVVSTRRGLDPAG